MRVELICPMGDVVVGHLMDVCWLSLRLMDTVPLSLLSTASWEKCTVRSQLKAAPLLRFDFGL